VLPKITVLTTGGTIAGLPAPGLSYRAGLASADRLFESLPGIHDLADVTVEAHVDVGSQDVDLAMWTSLAYRVRELLADATVDGVVITHGTDTLEETAFFLHLATQGDKPVVFTGAMRPPHALGADGPANLLAAVAVAASPDANTLGVCVMMNETLYDAVEVQKQRTEGVDAFSSRNHGPLARVYGRDLRVFGGREHGNPVLRGHFAGCSVDNWPTVHIVYAYAGMAIALLDAVLATAPHGIVVAGVGNGNASHEVWTRLHEKASKGLAVVRASRSAAGFVLPKIEVDDNQYGFIAGGSLNPQKARILLLLALHEGISQGGIQALYLGI